MRHVVAAVVLQVLRHKTWQHHHQLLHLSLLFLLVLLLGQ